MNLDHIEEGLLMSLQLNDTPTSLRQGFHPRTKLFVDGEQIGLISSIELKVVMSDVFPRLSIGVLEGLSQESWESLDPGIRECTKSNVEKLRRFPNVTVVCPEYLA